MNKTLEQNFLVKFNNKNNKNITLISKYVDCMTKIKCKCNDCRYEWESMPSVLLRNGGCPKCAGNIKKTHEVFIKEVRDLYGREYDVIGKYHNAKIKVEIKHNTCKNTFNMVPSNFLSGQQCPFCKGKRISEAQIMSDDEFRDRVFGLVGNEYSVMSNYMGANKNVVFKHNVCGHLFKMRPTGFINRGARCTNERCLHDRLSESMRDTEEEFKLKFDKRSDNEYELLSKYKLSNQKIKIKHKICGTIFEMKPNNFIQGQDCPICKMPRAENRIKCFCEKNNIEFVRQKSFSELTGIGGGLLLYDFYFPTLNILLEYQGEYHDGTLLGKRQTEHKFRTQLEHDNRKKSYAVEHGIKLLEIWYLDFENIEKILERELRQISDSLVS